MKPLDSQILNSEKILLSDSDIKNLTFDRCKILVYEELLNYKSIDDVFGSYEGIIVLYENTRNSGHWCLLFKVPNKLRTLYFFDPYGYAMDSEIKWSKYLIKQGFLQQPALSYLVKYSNYKLQQNKIRYQVLQDGVNTCGRHLCVRFNYRHLNERDYKTFLLGNQHYNPDFWVSILTRI